MLARTAKGVCAITLGSAEAALLKGLRARFPEAQLQEGGAEVEALLREVVAFAEAPKVPLKLPLDLWGTAFQQRVWQALQKVPLGQTTSYGELAAAIGAPNSVRAVAGACGANPVALAVPCHRVLRKDGSLSGYRWGTEIKKSLLAKEAALLAR